MDFWDRHLFGASRPWACGRAVGDVLEVAIGTGRNLPYYPDGIRLTGVDLSAQMLGIARDRAAGLGRQADLRPGDAQVLDFPDGSFDTVLCTLGLCAIPDDHRAISEMARVLRPGGRLLVADHLAARAAVLRGPPLAARGSHRATPRGAARPAVALGAHLHSAGRRALPAPAARPRARAGIRYRAGRTVQVRHRRAPGGPQA